MSKLSVGARLRGCRFRPAPAEDASPGHIQADRSAHLTRLLRGLASLPVEGWPDRDPAAGKGFPLIRPCLNRRFLAKFHKIAHRPAGERDGMADREITGLRPAAGR